MRNECVIKETLDAVIMQESQIEETIWCCMEALVRSKEDYGHEVYHEPLEVSDEKAFEKWMRRDYHTKESMKRMWMASTCVSIRQDSRKNI